MNTLAFKVKSGFRTRLLAVFVIALFMVSTLSVLGSTPVNPLMQLIRPVTALPPTPSLSLSKNTGFAADGVSADYVTVTGRGFAAGRDVAFYWVGKYPASGGLFPAGPTFAADVFAQYFGPTNVLPAGVFVTGVLPITFQSLTAAHGGDVRTDSYGFFKATLQIPSLPAGTWKLDVLAAPDGVSPAPLVTVSWAGTVGVSFTIKASIEEAGTGGSVHPGYEGYVGDSLNYYFGGFGKYSPGLVAPELVDVMVGSTFCYAGSDPTCIIPAVSTVAGSDWATTGLQQVKSMFGGTYTLTATGESSGATASSSVKGATQFTVDPKVWFWIDSHKTGGTTVLSADLSAAPWDVFVSAEGLPSGSTVTAATLAGQTLVPQAPYTFPITVYTGGTGPKDYGSQGSIGGGLVIPGIASYNAIDFKSVTGASTLGRAPLVLTGVGTFNIPDRCWVSGPCTGTTNSQDQGGLINSHSIAAPQPPFLVSSGGTGGAAAFTTEAAKSGSYSAKLSGGTDGGASYGKVQKLLSTPIPLSSVTDVNFWYRISSASTAVPFATENAWPLYVRSTDARLPFPFTAATADGYYSPYVVLMIYDGVNTHYIVSQIWNEPAANLNTWIQWKMTDKAVAYGGGTPTQALWHDDTGASPCVTPGGSWPTTWCPLLDWQTNYPGYNIVRIGIEAGEWSFTQNQVVYADLMSITTTGPTVTAYDIEQGGSPSTSLQVLTQAVGFASSFGCANTNPVYTVGSCGYEFVGAGFAAGETLEPLFFDSRPAGTQYLLRPGTAADGNGAWVTVTSNGLPKVTGFPIGGSYTFDVDSAGTRLVGDLPLGVAVQIVPMITTAGLGTPPMVFWHMGGVTISGTGFAAGEIVTVTIGGVTLPCPIPFAGSNPGTDEGEWNGDGTSVACVVASMPDLPGGTQVLAASTTSTHPTPTLTVKVVPFIDSSYPTPATGAVGTPVTIVGHGFPPGPATLSWGPINIAGVPASSVTVNSAGKFSVGVLVPNAPGLDGTSAACCGGVTLLDLSSGSTSLIYGQISYPQFTVLPSMPLSLGTAHVGDSVTVSATGLAANTAYELMYSNTGAATACLAAELLPFSGCDDTLVSVTSSAAGTLSGTFTVLTPGVGPVFPPTSNSRNVGIADAGLTKVIVTSPVNIVPKYTLNVPSGHPGDSVTITGTGFVASQTLKILFGGDLTANPVVTGSLVGTGITSGVGALSTTFTVPTVAAGTYKVQIWYDANHNGVQENGELATLPADVQTFTVNPSGVTGIAGVVRGTDNGIYYGSNVAGSWTGWNGLPGATSGAPGAVQCGGLLYLAVQGTDDGIYFGSLNTATGSFSGWSTLPGATSSGPGLAADSSCNLFLAVRGMDNGVYLNTYTGGAWQGWSHLPGATIDSPGVAVTASKIYLAVRGTNNGIYFGTVTRSGMTFNGWTSVGGATYGRPGLAAVSDSELYMTVGGTDNGIYLNKWNGASWAGWVAPAGGATPSGPGLIVYGGELYLMVQGTDNGIYWSSGTWGGSWSAWTKLSGATPSSPTLA
jgi:hypothetical protein